MLTYDQSHNDVWRTLRRVLDARDYEPMLRVLRGLYYFHDPWLADQSHQLYHELLPLPDTSRVLFELFLFGAKVDVSRVNAALGQDLTQSLTSLGLLVLDGDQIETDQYGIITQGGMYFLITFPHPNATDPRRAFNVYIGQDSLKLVHALDRSRHAIRALDLCSGSGVIGQTFAGNASHIDAVELCDEAIHVSRINAVLNGIEDRWQVHKSDLYTALKGQTYDLIVTNPPFVAVPSSAAEDFPIYGWGGDDGLLLIRNILEGAPAHLAPQGRLQMVFEGVGNAEGAAVEPLLQELATAHPKWSIKLNLYARMYLWEKPMRVSGEAIAQMQGDASEERIQYFTNEILQGLYKRDFFYMYKALLRIDTDPYFPSGLEVHRTYNPWDIKDIPKQKWECTFQPWTHQVMRSPWGTTLSMNDQEHHIIKTLDGKRSLGDAAQQVWADLGGPMSGTTPGLFAEQGLELCRVLHQLGFIEHPKGHWQQLDNTKNPFIVEKHPLEQALDAMEGLFKMMQKLEQQPVHPTSSPAGETDEPSSK